MSDVGADSFFLNLGTFKDMVVDMFLGKITGLSTLSAE